MIETLGELFSLGFVINALIAGSLIALCASLLGVSLVLKRYSMIGDGLSHVGFGALAVATVMNAAPLAVALPVVMAAAFLLLRISENGKIKGDAAIAMISSGSLAIGVSVVSLGGVNTDINSYLFGSIITTSTADVILSVILTAVVLVLYILFYNKIFAVTFDEGFARATGVRVELYKLMIALFTAVTIVLGMRMMGAMLISSMIIFPALTAMSLCKRFLTVTICSAAVAQAAFFSGLIASLLFDLPTGAAIVEASILLFALFKLTGFAMRKIR
jgi:zinc transport system permease protein